MQQHTFLPLHLSLSQTRKMLRVCGVSQQVRRTARVFLFDVGRVYLRQKPGSALPRQKDKNTIKKQTKKIPSFGGILFSHEFVVRGIFGVFRDESFNPHVQIVFFAKCRDFCHHVRRVVCVDCLLVRPFVDEQHCFFIVEGQEIFVTQIAFFTTDFIDDSARRHLPRKSFCRSVFAFVIDIYNDTHKPICSTACF